MAQVINRNNYQFAFSIPQWRIIVRSELQNVFNRHQVPVNLFACNQSDYRYIKTIDDLLKSFFLNKLVQRVNGKQYYNDILEFDIAFFRAAVYFGVPVEDTLLNISMLSDISDSLSSHFDILNDEALMIIHDQWLEWNILFNRDTIVFFSTGDYRVRRYEELLRDGIITQ